jgi:hypothetical protein
VLLICFPSDTCQKFGLHVEVIFKVFLYLISAASLKLTRYSGDRITVTRSYFPHDLGGQTKWGATNVINNFTVLGVILVRVANLLPDTKHKRDPYLRTGYLSIQG